MPHPSLKIPHAATRQQARTDATRRKLLTAAERIFARDGFEAARLVDIAAAAGFTRGALYAHFKDKEDIFFALLEQWVAERIAEVELLLENFPAPTDRLRALREHYSLKAKDRRLTLLSTEFKLFALRHPDTQARLRTRREKLRESGGNLLRKVLKDLGMSSPVPADATATALGALSQALVLEHLVDPRALSEDSIRKLLARLFDAVMLNAADTTCSVRS